MRVLVVEDDHKIASFVAKGLKEAGFAVDVAEDGSDGLAMALDAKHDAAVIDVMLPGIDGLELIQTMRSRGVNTPVLILSARHTVDDRVEGLQAGGDDYMVKPFSFEEVLARVQALIRRSTNTSEPTTLTVGDVQLDLLSRKVTRQGREVDLRPRELGLLELMMRNPGRMLSKTFILERVFEYDFDPQTNVVGVLVHRLRAGIDKDFEPKLIHTVRGVGYVFQP